MEMLSILALSVAAIALTFTGCLGCIMQHIHTFMSPPRRISNVRLHHIELQIGPEIVLKVMKKKPAKSSDTDVKLKCSIGRNILQYIRYNITTDQTSIKVTWENGVQLSVVQIQNESTEFYEVRWEQWDSQKSMVFTDMIDMSTASWYGGLQLFKQTWPISDWSYSSRAYTTSDSYQGQYGGVQERYWVASSGVAVFVDRDVPLFVSMESQSKPKLGLTAQFSNPYGNSQKKRLALTYTIVVGDNILGTHKAATKAFIDRPMNIPDGRMFRHPIWSTWAKFKQNINQDKVLEFAGEIKKNGFNNSQLEIDDDWTVHYGDMEFDPTKFPDPKKTISELKSMGFRTTLWVHPFASLQSAAFQEGRKKGYFIRSYYTRFPAILTWWNGLGAMLDLTNEAACRWYKSKLKRLQDMYGVDSFKFDAGESNFIPNGAITEVAMDNPNDYSKRFAELSYDMDPNTRMLEVRVGAGTQNLPVMVRLMDKNSNWGYDNGLRSLIPHVLTFGIIGYPFVLPDMIGGNAYTGITMKSSKYPDRELFVRWLEVNALLPALQFSVAPWQYDSEVVAITHAMCDLHQKFTSTIIKLAKEATETGAPIIRPVWWIAPADPEAFDIDSQFLLGNDVLVAPVVEDGARSRDIYLPTGKWRDNLRGGVHEGGQWFRSYRVDLAELPYFTRV